MAVTNVEMDVNILFETSCVLVVPSAKKHQLQHWQNNVTSITIIQTLHNQKVESSWNVMAHADAREGKWRANWRMAWVASTLHTTSEHGVSSITTADAHTWAARSRLNWRPRRFKWTCPFRRMTKSGFCACAITFQTQSTQYSLLNTTLDLRRKYVAL